MARKNIATSALSFVEIVMRADADTIRAALEARLKTDELLAEREQAYRRIAELEAQVEELMGEPGVFVYPPPPLPVASFKAIPASKKAAQPSAAKTATKTAATAQ
ncbi:MAG: hypothetical protein WCS95_04570 [Lentisphaeria bacterium]|nr:hypothetical protein [Lentisphaeria bacterium]